MKIRKLRLEKRSFLLIFLYLFGYSKSSNLISLTGQDIRNRIENQKALKAQTIKGGQFSGMGGLVDQYPIFQDNVFLKGNQF